MRTPPAAADDPVLGRAVERLVAALAPDRIYLFGSRARGDAGPDADYDFMVVVGESADPALTRARTGYRALLGLGIAKDVLVWTREEFDSMLHLKASLPATVVREGRLLHGG